MDPPSINLLLADDDKDDCLFFKEALEEIPMPAMLTTVNDGVELMHRLAEKSNTIPDILFLDLNMPRKSGFECLKEIKKNQKFIKLPVIIFSTSFDEEVVNLLYDHGAQYYIRKPAIFSQLKNIIHQALTVLEKNNFTHPSKENFVLTGDFKNK